MRKTQEEIDAMTPAELKIYKRQQQDIVFGSDCPRGPGGKPIEQGIGSALQPSRNHVEALRNNIRHGVEKDPDGKIIAKAEKDLAEYLAKPRQRQEEDA